MGLLFIPLVLVLTLGPDHQPSDDALENFSRFSRSLNRQIVLVDRDGTVREGMLIDATADDVTMQFGSGTRSFPRATVMSAERLTDGRKDGAIKGAIVGAVIGVLVMQGFSTLEDGLRGWGASVLIYSGIGWAIDAAQSHRAIYRASPPSPPAASVKLSLRF